jgi:hypothetical protein
MQLLGSLGICDSRATGISMEKKDTSLIAERVKDRYVSVIADNLNEKVPVKEGGSRMLNVGIAVVHVLQAQRNAEMNVPQGSERLITPFVSCFMFFTCANITADYLSLQRLSLTSHR